MLQATRNLIEHRMLLAFTPKLHQNPRAIANWSVSDRKEPVISILDIGLVQRFGWLRRED